MAVCMGGGFFRLFFLVYILACFLIPCPLFAEETKDGGAAAKPNDDALLKTLLVQNKAARDRFSSYIVEQEWKTFTPYQDPGAALSGLPQAGPSSLSKEDLNSSLWMRLTKKDDQLFLERKERLEAVSGNWKDERFIQCVVNHKYCAVYSRLQGIEPMLSLWEHGSVATMRSNAKGTLGLFSKPYALDYATGNGVFSLDEIVAIPNKWVKWSVGDSQFEGDPMYAITQTVSLKDGKSKRYIHFYLDPRKDFLLRGMQSYNADGSLYARRSTELQYLEEARAWFPKKVHNQVTNGSEMWLTVKEVKLNPSIDDAVFSIASFDVAPNTLMVRAPVQGARMTYRFRQGEWAPSREPGIR